ncbi:MAG: hypothetical protein ACFFDF_00670 [Candidatus Odinarchaeota archaeon]
MSEEYDEYEINEDINENEELEDEDLEDLDDGFEPHDEYEDIDKEEENNFEPHDEYEDIDEELENKFEPREEPLEDQEQEIEKDINEEYNDEQSFGREEQQQKGDKPSIKDPSQPDKPPKPPDPPKTPDPPKSARRTPLGPKPNKGPVLRKSIRDIFKKKNWRKPKKRFTKTNQEISQALTDDQYRKLKYDKHKG